MLFRRICLSTIGLVCALPLFAAQPLQLQINLDANTTASGDYRVVSVAGACSAYYSGTDHTRPLRSEHNGYSSPLAKFYFYKDRNKKPDFALMARGITWQQQIPVIVPGRRLNDKEPVIWVANSKKPSCVALQGRYSIPNKDNTPGSDWQRLVKGSKIPLTINVSVFVDGKIYTSGAWHEQGFANLSVGAARPKDPSINMQNLPEPATAETFVVEPKVLAPNVVEPIATPKANSSDAATAQSNKNAAEQKAAVQQQQIIAAEQKRRAQEQLRQAKLEQQRRDQEAAEQQRLLAAEKQRQSQEQARLARVEQQRIDQAAAQRQSIIAAEQKRRAQEKIRRAELEKQRIAAQKAEQLRLERLAAQAKVQQIKTQQQAQQQKQQALKLAAEQAWARQRAKAQASTQQQQAALELSQSQYAAKQAANQQQLNQRNERADKARNLAQQRQAISPAANTRPIQTFSFQNAQVFFYRDKQLQSIQLWPSSDVALTIAQGSNSAIVHTSKGQLSCELNNFDQQLDLQRHCSHPVTLNGLDAKCSYFDISVIANNQEYGLFNSNTCPTQISLPNLDVSFKLFAAGAKASWSAQLSAEQSNVVLVNNKNQNIEISQYKTLPGTRVSLIAPNQEVLTNRTSNGKGEFAFTLRPWQQKLYSIRLVKPGYLTQTIALDSVNSEIKLTPVQSVKTAAPLNISGAQLLSKHQVQLANIFFTGSYNGKELKGRLIDFDYLPTNFVLTDLNDENTRVSFDDIANRFNSKTNSIDVRPSQLVAPYSVQLRNQELKQDLHLNSLRVQLADKPWQTLSNNGSSAFNIDLVRNLTDLADISINPLTLCAEGYLPITEKDWFFNNQQLSLTPVHPETTLMLMTGDGDDVARYLHRVAQSIAQLKIKQPWFRVGQSYDGIFYPSSDINRASENLPEDANNRLWAEIEDALKNNSKVPGNLCGTPKRKVVLFAAGNLHYFIGSEQKLPRFLKNNELKVISNLSFEQAQQQLQSQYHYQLAQLWQEHWHFADNQDQLEQTIRQQLNTPATTRGQ